MGEGSLERDLIVLRRCSEGTDEAPFRRDETEELPIPRTEVRLLSQKADPLRSHRKLVRNRRVAPAFRLSESRETDGKVHVSYPSDYSVRTPPRENHEDVQ